MSAYYLNEQEDPVYSKVVFNNIDGDEEELRWNGDNLIEFGASIYLEDIDKAIKALQKAKELWGES